MRQALTERGAASAASPTRSRPPADAAPIAPPPPPAAPTATLLAYYEARAPEYDDWYLRRGRYARGPIHDAAWNAELDVAGRWLDGLPIAGEIVELAAGTGWWSPLLASKGELSIYDGNAAPLDIARERLVAHKLRAHIHVRDAWARAGSPVDAVFTGFWLSHVPRERLDAFLAVVAAGSSPAARSPSSIRDRTRSRAPPTTRRPPTTSRVRRLDDGREFTIVKVYWEPGRAGSRAGRAGFDGRDGHDDRPVLPDRRPRLGRPAAAEGRSGSEAPPLAAILRAMSPLAKSTIATVGSGVMAEAMIAGLLRGKLVEPEQVVASHPRAGTTRGARP